MRLPSTTSSCVLLRGRARHRRPGPAPGVQQHRLLPLRPFTARLGDRPGVRLREPRGHRDHGHVGQRGAVRPADHALLLDRRRSGDAVPRSCDDAVLLRLEGPLRAGVHAPPVRPDRPPGQRAELCAGPGADRRREPLPARHHRECASGLAALGLPGRRGRDRAGLHHARWSVGGDLQRGAAVLRHRRRTAPAHPGRPAQGRWLGRPEGQGHREPGRAEQLSAWPGNQLSGFSNDFLSVFGIIFGLGFVLSFGYWTTNFVEVHARWPRRACRPPAVLR